MSPNSLELYSKALSPNVFNQFRDEQAKYHSLTQLLMYI